MTAVFWNGGFLDPQLTVVAQAFLRIFYGVLLLGTLIMLLPQWRRFFISERWDGYAQSSLEVDCLQNPFAAVPLCAIWFACSIMLIFGQHTVAAAAINLLLCRYFFVHMRWKGLLRGFGAPGYMTYWLGAVVFFLELTLHFATSQRSLALLVAQVDFAFIMLSSGIYKLTAGYAGNDGMELGMVNPEWGYWWKFYRTMPPGHFLFKILNHLAWSTEILAGVLMLIPATRFIGGVLILASFVFIATQIRLGLLCEMVIACCLLFFHPGSFGDQILASCTTPNVLNFVPTNLAAVTAACSAFLWSYLLLLPAAHAGLFYNFYARKALPGVLQAVLEKYTNFFGVIIWRVFSADVTNFFPLIYRTSCSSGERELVSKYGWRDGLRYNHVGESIVLTSIFTTLKYHRSNMALFNERLLRYARTIPCPADCVLEFEYMSIRKTAANFQFVPIAVYAVDIVLNTVTEKLLETSASVREAHPTSPVHEGARPGSYLPLRA